MAINISGSFVDDTTPMTGNVDGVPHLGIQGPPGPQGASGGYYVPAIEQTGENELEVSFSPSLPDMPAVEPVQVELPHSGGNIDLTGYATEQYVKEYAQPKGNYLTEVPEGYAKTEDIPKNVVKSVNGVTPDTNGNVEITIPDSGGNAVPVYYTTEEATVDEGFPFDPYQIETNGKTINVGDWIVTPSGKVFVVVGVSAGMIDANYDETLSVEAPCVKTVNGVKPDASGNVEITIPDSGGNVDFRTDETLILKDGVLSVNTTDSMEQDNTLPITSAGVFATVGNIEALLKTI
jgi:hypothetical protein